MDQSNPSRLESKIETIQEAAGQQRDEVIVSSLEKDADTRQAVARKFVNYYFKILLLILLGIPVFNLFAYRVTGNTDLVIALKDMVLTYSAVVGPTLGLVVAYYFKSKGD